MPLHSSLGDRVRLHLKKKEPELIKNNYDWVWWLMPIIQALWRPRWVDHLKSGVQDQPDHHDETLSLIKKKEKKKKTRKGVLSVNKGGLAS